MNPMFPMTALGLCVLLPNVTDKDDDRALRVSQDNELRVFSTAGMTGELTRDEIPRLGLAIGKVRDRNDDAFYWDEHLPEPALVFGVLSRRAFDIDQLIESARNLDAAAWEKENATIQAGESRVLATNSRAVLDAVGKHWETTRATVTPRLSVHYVCFEAKDASSPTSLRLALADAKDLHGKATRGQLGRVLDSSGTRCKAGDRIHLGVGAHTSLQGDLSVEVAKNAKIGDPEVEQLHTGIGLTCLPLVHVDGKSVGLFGLFTWRHLGADGIRTQDLVAPGLQNVELATVKQAQSALSVNLGEGGGYVFAPGGSVSPNMRVLVVVERLDRAPQDGAAGIVPTGFVTGHVFRRIPCDERKRRGGIRIGDGDDVDQLIEMSRTLSGAPDKIESTTGPLHIQFGGPAQAVAAARRAIRFATKELGRSFVIEVISERQSKAAASSQWQRHGTPVTIPCLAGRVGYALTGFEQTYIGDFQVEIAEEATISDPVVLSVFDGAKIATGIQVTGDECRIELLVLARNLQDLRRVGAAATDVGAVWCPDVSEARMRRTLSIKPGETQQIGAGPDLTMDGGVYRTRLSVRLTEL